ncbi:MAG: hypothetical protein JNL82_16065 [Myxococcales bacterium]|nr:hypothetical protein [Myxococcales bacterium]
MEKVPLQDILESILRELESLKSTEQQTAIFADVAIAGIGSTMNLIRCIHTALATGADPRRVRQFINTHLRRTMAADSAAIQELAWVPDESADSFPGTMSDFAERVVSRMRTGEAQKPKASRPYEVRLTPEEAVAGCVLPIRLESGVTVDVTFPAGTRDGHLSTRDFDGEEIKILVRVLACRKKGRSGRSARKTQQPPALPPPITN